MKIHYKSFVAGILVVTAIPHKPDNIDYDCTKTKVKCGAGIKSRCK